MLDQLFAVLVSTIIGFSDFLVTSTNKDVYLDEFSYQSGSFISERNQETEGIESQVLKEAVGNSDGEMATEIIGNNVEANIAQNPVQEKTNQGKQVVQNIGQFIMTPTPTLKDFLDDSHLPKSVVTPIPTVPPIPPIPHLIDGLPSYTSETGSSESIDQFKNTGDEAVKDIEERVQLFIESFKFSSKR